MQIYGYGYGARGIAATPVKGGRVFAPPSGLSWPATINGAAVPQSFRLNGGEFTALAVGGGAFDPKTLVNAAIWSATPYYVDPTKADNTGDGLSWATAKRDINAAITLANGDGQTGARILCKGGDYHQTRSINGSAGTVEPTKPTALIAQDGRVRHFAGTIETFSATPDATYPNTYVGGPSTAVRVFDRLNLDEHGNYTELTNAASHAACNTTPNSWIDLGTNLAVNRADGLQPTVANTLITRPSINVAALDSCTSDLYIEGFDFEGGQNGALWIDPVATRNVVLIDNTYKYSVASIPGLRVRRTIGIVYIDGGEASKNGSDGWNFHTDSSGGLMYVLALNIAGWNNGISPSSSNNTFTTHDDVIASLLSTQEMGDSYLGAEVHCIETTKTWVVGTKVETYANGDTHPTCYKASNTAEMWLERATANSPDYALHAQATAGKIHKRNVTIIAGTEQVDSGATIDTF